MGTIHLAVLHVRDDGSFGLDDCVDMVATEEDARLVEAAWLAWRKSPRRAPVKVLPALRRLAAVGGAR